MAKSKSKVAQVQDAALVIEQDLTAARKAHEKALAALAKDPGNETVQAEVDQLEQAIEQHQRAAKRNAQMRSLAARQDNLAAQQAGLAELKSDVAAVDKALDEWAQASVRLGEVAAEFASVRARIRASAEDARRTAWHVFRRTLGPEMAQRRAGAHLSQLTAGFGDVAAAAQLNAAVDGTLISATAVAPSRPVAESMERVRFRLINVLQRAIAEHESALQKLGALQ